MTNHSRSVVCKQVKHIHHCIRMAYKNATLKQRYTLGTIHGDLIDTLHSKIQPEQRLYSRALYAFTKSLYNLPATTPSEPELSRINRLACGKASRLLYESIELRLDMYLEKAAAHAYKRPSKC